MGRQPTRNFNLPPRMRARQKSGGVYYYYDTGGKPRREIPLGKDYTAALRKWADLEDAGSKQIAARLTTFKHVADRYQREVVPLKAARTQKDNTLHIAQLLKFFNDPPAPFEAIQPINIRQYLDWRKDAPVRANREIAIFSHIWNKAREWGITDKANPCIGVAKHKETPREVYVEDDVFQAVYSEACQPLKDAMDLAYLCAQRPADTIKLAETDIKDGALAVTQNKTRKKLLISIEGELKQVVDRIAARKASHKVRTLKLICSETGRALSQDALLERFNRARERAANAAAPGVAERIREFQFRDLRAKAATDIANASDLRVAQKLLGHTSERMTETYNRNRKGDLVKPTR